MTADRSAKCLCGFDLHRMDMLIHRVNMITESLSIQDSMHRAETLCGEGDADLAMKRPHRTAFLVEWTRL